MDPSVPGMKGKLKHVKRHRQGSLCQQGRGFLVREERTAGREAEEEEGRKELLHPCFEKSLGVRGLFGEQLERERMLSGAKVGDLKSFTVHTCALQLQRQ